VRRCSGRTLIEGDRRAPPSGPACRHAARAGGSGCACGRRGERRRSQLRRHGQPGRPVRGQGTTEAHDHQLVGDTLKSIAGEAGIEIGDTLNAQFQKKLDSLRALSGEAFDAAYLRDMEDIHAKDGAAFAKEAKSGGNPKLRAFAAETHRIVERHIGELKAVGPTGE